jgi:succinate dehydrogenase / fumarate reductase cytochrome b subunit
MIGFVIAHLAGNLTIYLGPETFNGYAEKLAGLGPLLWVMRIGLIAAALVHIGLTMRLVYENRAAREDSYYAFRAKGERSWATRTMAYSGVLIVVFLVLHLYDFTFAIKDGPQSLIEGVNAGESAGLFGLVWTSFNEWWRVGFYVLAMAAVGAHLSHAIESVFQTFGLHHTRYTPIVKMLSVAVGALVFLGFAAIPLYVLIARHPLGA